MRSSRLEQALRKVTEGLAREMGSPAGIAPDWSAFEWAVARAVASMHGVSPLLARTLQWRGPGDWVKFIEEQRAHTAARHARVEELAQAIDRRAREAGLAAVGLKGMALHALGLYRPGDRPMADIDMLVRPGDAPRTAALLESLGFVESTKTWKERAFTPIAGRKSCGLGEHADNDIKIELHERICERLPWRIADVSDLIFPSRARPGLNAYASMSSLMTHLLLHAAGTMPTRTLRLLHLNDLAKLSLRMTASDWDEVLAHSKRRRLWWAFPPLELAARYFPSTVPARVLECFAEECPGLLTRISRGRVLYDVSLSYLWIDAFPGIEWSQSVGEMLHYAARRVRPDAEHRALREQVAQSEAWVADWNRLSQTRRLVRWVASRPARPLTLHAVRAAMARTPRAAVLEH